MRELYFKFLKISEGEGIRTAWGPDTESTLVWVDSEVSRVKWEIVMLPESRRREELYGSPLWEASSQDVAQRPLVLLPWGLFILWGWSKRRIAQARGQEGNLRAALPHRLVMREVGLSFVLCRRAFSLCGCKPSSWVAVGVWTLPQGAQHLSLQALKPVPTHLASKTSLNLPHRSSAF